MLPSPIPTLEHQLHRWASYLAYLLMGIAIAVLIGWIFDIYLLKHVFEGYVSMRPTTAICFLCSGIALLHLSKASSISSQHWRCILPIGLSLIIATASLSHYLLNGPLGIDSLISYAEKHLTKEEFSWRMSFVSALCFILSGIALILTEFRKGSLLPNLLSGITLATGFIFLAGYIFKSSDFQTILNFTALAIHTSIGFIILGIGILFCQRRSLFLHILLSKTPTGSMYRRLIPGIIIIPVILSLFRFYGEKRNFYESEMGILIFTISSIFLLILFVSITAKLTYHYELKRQALEVELNSFFNSSFDLMSISTLDGIQIKLNPAFENILGWKIEDLLGKTLIGIMHPDDQEKMKIKMKEKLLGEDSVRTRNRILCRDGSYKIIEWNCPAIREGDNFFYATGRDITQAVKDQEFKERMATIVENTEDMVLTLNREGNITSWNKGAEHISGFSKEEVLGRHVSLLFPKNFHVKLEKLLKIVHQGDNVIHYEIKGVRKNGEMRDIALTISTFKNDEGKIIGSSYIGRDITEIKEMENKLKQSEERLKSILENSPTAIYLQDIEGRYLMVNKKYEELFQIHSEQIKGKNFFDVLPEEQAQIFYDHSKSILEKAEPIQFEEIIPIGEEQHTFLSWHFPLLDNQARPYALCGILTDISERKKIEQMKNEFISTVSHELRTPLTSIRGSLGLIIGDMEENLSPNLKILFDIAINNCERLVRLINDILDIEKIESGKMIFHFKPILIKKWIEETLEANQGLQAQNNVHFQYDSEDDHLQVEGDRDRLIQVLTNLISNAAKYSPKGGTIKLRSFSLNDKVMITVQDQGPGIPESFRKKIFMKFSQVDSSDTRLKGGTGLGLSISKSIIEKHGGEIHYYSRNNGTTFFFLLPKYHFIPSIKNQNTKRKILICENDPEIVLALCQIIQKIELEANICFSGIQLLEQLEKNTYQAIVIDLRTPDINANELIHQIRNHPKGNKIPLIGISGVAKHDLKKRNKFHFEGQALNILDWFKKPISPHQINTLLKQYKTESSNNILRILDINSSSVIDLGENTIHEANVTRVTNMTEAKKMIIDKNFDVFFLDLDFPDEDSEEVLSLIQKKNHNKVPIVFFSSPDTYEKDPEKIAFLLIRQKSYDEILEKILQKIIHPPIFNFTQIKQEEKNCDTIRAQQKN